MSGRGGIYEGPGGELLHGDGSLVERASRCPEALPETEYCVSMRCDREEGHDGPHRKGGWKWHTPSAASSQSDELRSIGSFSVLSEADREIIAACKRWLRHMWLEATPGYSMKLDTLDHDSVFETMKQIDDLYARTASESQVRR